MPVRDVDLLWSYLEAFPELKNRVKDSPLRVFCKDRWRAIRGVRKLHPGLEISCPGGVRVILCPDSTKRYSREQTRHKLLALIRDFFGPVQPTLVLDKTDRNRHQTEAILRVYARSGQESLAILAIYEEESSDLSSRLLTSLTLWWDQLKDADSVAILLPERWSERVLTLLPLLSIPVKCFKYCIETGEVCQIYPTHERHSQVNSPYVIFPMVSQAPELFTQLGRLYPVLDLLFRHGNWELSYRGFPIAWAGLEGMILYDLQQPKRIHDLSSIQTHIRQVLVHRSFPPPSPSHFCFRFGEERWLESLVLRNHGKINREFTGQIYCQVPTWVGQDRRVLDLLTITRRGRLAVLELKTQKDLNLLFQGLDYWERVEHHRLQGDFGPAGYFSGMEILDKPPLLYLVCPLFEFHQVSTVLRDYVKRDLVVRCVGLNSDWKRRFRILRQFEL